MGFWKMPKGRYESLRVAQRRPQVLPDEISALLDEWPEYTIFLAWRRFLNLSDGCFLRCQATLFEPYCGVEACGPAVAIFDRSGMEWSQQTADRPCVLQVMEQASLQIFARHWKACGRWNEGGRDKWLSKRTTIDFVPRIDCKSKQIIYSTFFTVKILQIKPLTFSYLALLKWPPVSRIRRYKRRSFIPPSTLQKLQALRQDSELRR